MTKGTITDLYKIRKKKPKLKIKKKKSVWDFSTQSGWEIGKY